MLTEKRNYYRLHDFFAVSYWRECTTNQHEICLRSVTNSTPDHDTPTAKSVYFNDICLTERFPRSIPHSKSTISKLKVKSRFVCKQDLIPLPPHPRLVCLHPADAASVVCQHKAFLLEDLLHVINFLQFDHIFFCPSHFVAVQWAVYWSEICFI